MDDVRAFLDASEAFFRAVAAVAWGALALAVLLHLLRLALRVRGWQNIIRAAYPDASELRARDVTLAYLDFHAATALVFARTGEHYTVHMPMSGRATLICSEPDCWISGSATPSWSTRSRMTSIVRCSVSLVGAGSPARGLTS